VTTAESPNWALSFSSWTVFSLERSSSIFDGVKASADLILAFLSSGPEK
jgi:hypothetical protein